MSIYTYISGTVGSIYIMLILDIIFTTVESTCDALFLLFDHKDGLNFIDVMELLSRQLILMLTPASADSDLFT